MRYALGIEYDGSGFLGWQSQRQGPTVQDSLEQALSVVADHPVRVVCAGRTDAGVHALGQVAHFDSEAPREPRSWILGANANLPDAACVRWLKAVEPDFHARFSAVERRYRYTICNRWVRPALGRHELSWCRQRLDAGAMQRAVQCLLGEHDFSAFRSSGCRARHAIRRVNQVEVRRDGDRVVLDIAANGFLYHMVRNIAGSLLLVGAGERPVEWLSEVLAGGDRQQVGVTAPAGGLCFMAVRYPPAFGIPECPAAFPVDAEGP